MKYKFHMSDCWGDDYHLTVEGNTYDEAKSKANRADDDAVVGHLIEDIRGTHNYVWASATDHDMMYHYICTRCGSRASLPQEADAFPPNEGECVRTFQPLKELK